jgi:hypothetical protein
MEIKKDFNGGDVVTLSKALATCLLSQRTYGKQGSDLKALTEIFLEDLKEYEPEKVMNAITQWRRTEAEFPTPSDIRKIIENNQPVPVEVYIRASGILRKPENYRSWEIETAQKICSKYEKQALGFDI